MDLAGVLAGGLCSAQVLVQCMFAVNRLQLLKIADEDHKRNRAELSQCRLEAMPHLRV